MLSIRMGFVSSAIHLGLPVKQITLEITLSAKKQTLSVDTSIKTIVKATVLFRIKKNKQQMIWPSLNKADCLILLNSHLLRV